MPAEIPQLRVISTPLVFLRPMEQGVNVPWLVQESTSDVLWVRKDVNAIGLSNQGLCGECLTWLVCQRLGIPTPDGAIWRGPTGELAWLSRFLDGALPWKPRRRAAVQDWSPLSAILALDVVLLNRDRNSRNLLVDFTAAGQLRPWAIDHERVGAVEPAFLSRHLEATLHELPGFLASGSQPRGLLSQRLRAPALEAAERFAALGRDDKALREDARSSLVLSGYAVEEPDKWMDQLRYRFLNAADLVERYLSSQGV